MKRAAEFACDDSEYEGTNGFEVAKLVCTYGFMCVNDMRMFSRSLNSAFWNWARAYVYDRGALIWSSSSRTEKECFHRAYLGVDLLRHEIMKLRPEKWFHAYHATWTYDANTWRTSDILLLACTTISKEPFACHSILCLLQRDGLPCEGPQKVEGQTHAIRVDHHHQPGRYAFRICMKWTGDSVGASIFK